MKYKITKIKKNGLFQIQSLIKIPKYGIEAGDFGGYIQKEANLSQEGSCWVSGNSWISGDAQVSGNAWIVGNAQIYGDAWVSGNSWISGDAQVSGNSWISGNSQVSDDAWISGDAQVSGNSWVFGTARVSDTARVFGNAQVSGNSWILGNAQIKDKKDLVVSTNTQFAITVTPQNIVIGCEVRSRFENGWGKVSKDEAKKLGLSEDLYDLTKQQLRIYRKLVPRKRATK